MDTCSENGNVLYLRASHSTMAFDCWNYSCSCSSCSLALTVHKIYSLFACHALQQFERLTVDCYLLVSHCLMLKSLLGLPPAYWICYWKPKESILKNCFTKKKKIQKLFSTTIWIFTWQKQHLEVYRSFYPSRYFFARCYRICRKSSRSFPRWWSAEGL